VGGESETEGTLLERERELASVESALGRAASGSGGVMVVEGVAGIGKSALLGVAERHARDAGLRVLQARGSVLERAYPLGVATQLLGGGLRLRETGRAEGSTPAARETVADAAGKRFLVLEALLRRLTRLGPALVAVDDLHWVDAESGRFLAFAAARVDRLPLLLLMAARPGEPGADHELLRAILSTATVLRPEPLSVEALDALLSAHGIATEDRELAAACHRSTGGNPFLAHELARTLAARASDGMSQPSAAAIASATPAGLGKAVLARVGALSDAAAAVAGAVAVLGGRSEPRLVAALTGVEQHAVAAAADLLVDAGVLAVGRPLEFVHPLVEAAVYEDLPRARREATHRAAARLLAGSPRDDPDRIAAHLLNTDPSGDAWVVQQLERAARRALEAYSAEAACAYLERALREPPDDSRSVELLTLLGEAQQRAGAPERAIDTLRAALERAEGPVARALVIARLQPVLTHAQHGDLGAGLLAGAIADLPASERELGLELESQLQMAGLVHMAAARATAGRAPRFTVPARAPASRGERLALAVQASAQTARGTAEAAGQLAELALADGELLADEGPESPLFHLAAYALIHSERFAAAERELEAAIELARSRRSVLGEAIARGVRAEGRYRQGRLEQVAADAAVALAATRYGLRFGPRPAAGALVMTLVDQGRPVEATRALTDWGFDGALPAAATSVWLAHARGRLHASLGDHERAISEFELCARIEGGFEITTPVLAPWRASRALSLAALGRRREASELFEQAIARARAFGAPRALGIALTAAGRVTDDLELLDEAVSVLEAAQSPLEHARALLALGAATRRSGRRAAARPALEQALTLARRCGATALAEDAHHELLAAGGAPRKLTRAGADALTAAERRVAELAADGHTNSEIATRLVISVRTVEAHLAHAYRKLDIHGRRQLAGALARHPQVG